MKDAVHMKLKILTLINQGRLLNSDLKLQRLGYSAGRISYDDGDGLGAGGCAGICGGLRLIG